MYTKFFADNGLDSSVCDAWEILALELAYDYCTSMGAKPTALTLQAAYDSLIQPPEHYADFVVERGLAPSIDFGAIELVIQRLMRMRFRLKTKCVVIIPQAQTDRLTINPSEILIWLDTSTFENLPDVTQRSDYDENAVYACVDSERSKDGYTYVYVNRHSIWSKHPILMSKPGVSQ